MTINQASELVGGLSNPSKMPCYSYSIPAKNCITGAKLRAVKGSVCSKCYAFRGNYGFPAVKNALEKRLNSLADSNWVAAMSFLINCYSAGGFFRWHDSGDLQSIEHFAKIVQVCEATPTTRHWLPTREYGIVSSYVSKGGVIPKNLTVRLSALALEKPAPQSLAVRLGVQTSTVTKANSTCPAPLQGNKCATCRACWDKSVQNVAYKQH